MDGDNIMPYKAKTKTKRRTNAYKCRAWSGWYNLKIWKVARRNQLTSEPLCRECKKEGVDQPAREVDHIIPHKGNWELFIDSDNLQSLCSTHHSRKTYNEMVT